MPTADESNQPRVQHIHNAVPANRHFQQYIGRQKSYHIFSHKPKHFTNGDAMENPILTNRYQTPKPPFPWGMSTPSNTPTAQLTPVTTTINISNDSRNFAQLCHKVPIAYNGMPHIHPQNCPFPFDDLQPHLIHQSLDQPHSSFQMMSRSNQQFFHNSPTRQTDRMTDQPTDGIGDKPVPTPAYALHRDAAKRKKWKQQLCTHVKISPLNMLRCTLVTVLLAVQWMHLRENMLLFF